MAPQPEDKDSRAENKVPRVTTETPSTSSESKGEVMTMERLRQLLDEKAPKVNQERVIESEKITTKRSSGNVAKAEHWKANNEHHAELLKRLQGHFGQGPMKKFVDSKGKRSIFFEYEEKLLSEVLATYPHDKECKPYRPLQYPLAIAIVFMKHREDHMAGFDNNEIKLGFTDKQIRDKLDHMWKEKKNQENRNQQPTSTARLAMELAVEMSENEQPGPSARYEQSGRQTGQQPQSSSTEDQENMEIDPEGARRVPVPRDQRGAKRRRQISDDNATKRYKTLDAAANAEAARGSSQSAVERGAPKKKPSKKARENLEEESRKQLEQQQKMMMEQKKKKMEERKQVEEHVSGEQNRPDQIEKDEMEQMDEQRDRDQQQEQEEDHMEEEKHELEQNDRGQRDEEQEEDEQDEQKLEGQLNAEEQMEEDQVQQQMDDAREGVEEQQNAIPAQDIENAPIENSPTVSSPNKELEIVVEKDNLIIQAIPEEERLALLQKAKEFIALELGQMAKEPSSDQTEGTKWAVVRSILQKVANDLSKDDFINSPSEVLKNVVKTFTTNMLKCEHQVDEEETLYKICREFTRIMSTAFCCKRLFIATSVDESCKGHGGNCKIKDGHRCFKKDENYYCMKWLEEGNTRAKTMKEAIYRHFQPEEYEQCTTCNIVWHKKCRLTRLLENPKSIQCRSSNDMPNIQHFSEHIGTTPLQEALSKNYHTNRGILPEVRFIHSICETTTPTIGEMRKVSAKRTDFTHTANQIFVTVLIQNVETMIFSFTTQEYRSGPKKGWVVIDGHPNSQQFLKKVELNGWYLGLFQGGEKEFGTMDTEYKKTYFKEVLEKTTVKDMCDSLVLVNGFWNAEIERILEKMPVNEDRRFEYFKNEIKKVKDASESSLFYVKLTEDGVEDKEIKKPEKLFPNEITADRETFLEEQIQNDIEFTDLRQAQFATRQILMEVYLARHGTSGPRNTPKPHSVFSGSSIKPTWSHDT